MQKEPGVRLISSIWNGIQRVLFKDLEEDLGPLSDKQLKLATVLEAIRLEDELKSPINGPGRPEKDRLAIARAFVAKAIYNFSTTRMLLDRLECDIALRRICGFERKQDIPSESVFSRAFAEFAETGLLNRVHEKIITESYEDRLIGHNSRDSTAIEAREKPIKKSPPDQPKNKKKRGRPKKGEEKAPKEPTRIERQYSMTLSEMLKDLPKSCDVGSKKNSQGYTETWTGYKLHWDVADGDVPISVVLTSASTHDSQVALPLMAISEQRTTYLYELMDSAYDSRDIRLKSALNEHVAIIDQNPRGKEKIPFAPHQAERYKQRTSVERANSRLKDEFGGRSVRVRGHAKVLAHLMFGIIVLTVEQLIKIAVQT
jgi:transposase